MSTSKQQTAHFAYDRASPTLRTMGTESTTGASRPVKINGICIKSQLLRHRAGKIVDGYQALRRFCGSVPPARAGDSSMTEELVLIDDEREEKISAKTSLSTTTCSSRFKSPKKRLIHMEEDDTSDTLPQLPAKGKTTKRAKCTHLDVVAATGDDDTTPRTEKCQGGNTARMTGEKYMKKSGVSRLVSAALQPHEELASTKWDEEMGVPAESLVAAHAIFTASRAEGVRGVSLAKFLGAMLNELEVDIDICSIPIPSTTILVPFLSAPNKPWPQRFLSGWTGTKVNFANFWVRRAYDSDRIEFGVSSGVISGEINPKSDEFNSLDLAEMQNRVPKASIAHFAAVKKISKDIGMHSSIRNQDATVFCCILKGSDMQLLSRPHSPDKLVLLIEL